MKPTGLPGGGELLVRQGWRWLWQCRPQPHMMDGATVDGGTPQGDIREVCATGGLHRELGNGRGVMRTFWGV